MFILQILLTLYTIQSQSVIYAAVDVYASSVQISESLKQIKHSKTNGRKEKMNYIFVYIKIVSLLGYRARFMLQTYT